LSRQIRAKRRWGSSTKPLACPHNLLFPYSPPVEPVEGNRETPQFIEVPC
jgi:hypothetical protein